MAAGKKVGPASAKAGVAWDQGAAGGDSDELAGMLEALGDSPEVSITREQPGYAAGFVGTWEVHDRDPLAFLTRLQAECGGSVYLIRPLRREVNGQKKYATGARRVRISGPPLVEGRRWNTDSGPPILDTTARLVPQPLVAAAELALPQGALGLMEAMANRLGALEQRLTTPAPAPMAGPAPDAIATTLATMKGLAELQKIAAGFGSAPVEYEDDDDDEAEEQAPTIEDMITRLISKKLDADDKPAAPAADTTTGPRLIRNGADVTDHGATTTTPPVAATPAAAPAAAPVAAAAPAPARDEQGPQAVAQVIAQMGPEEAVEFLMQMTGHLPPEVQAGLQAAALSRMAAAKDGTEG